DLKVTYLVFPGTADKPFGPPDLEKLQARCEALVKEIGGASVPLHHWENIIPPPPTPTPTPSPSPSASPTTTPSPGSSASPSPSFAFPSPSPSGTVSASPTPPANTPSHAPRPSPSRRHPAPSPTSCRHSRGFKLASRRNRSARLCLTLGSPGSSLSVSEACRNEPNFPGPQGTAFRSSHKRKVSFSCPNVRFIPDSSRQTRGCGDDRLASRAHVPRYG